MATPNHSSTTGPYLGQMVHQPLLTARKLFSVQKHAQHAGLRWKRLQATKQHHTNLYQAQQRRGQRFIPRVNVSERHKEHLRSARKKTSKSNPLAPPNQGKTFLILVLRFIYIQTYPARSSLHRIVALGKHQELAKTPMHALETHTKGSMFRHHLPRVRLVACFRAEQ